MTNYDVGHNPQGIVAADFNNDGHLDLATANLWDGTISVLRGNDNGTFQPAQNIAGGGRSIAVGDFNGDDMLDLLTSNGTSVSVLISNGDATFLPPVSTEIQGVGDSISMAVGDFNDDGLLDVAVGTYSYYWGGPTGTQVEVLLGDGDGGFTHGDLHSVPRSSYHVPLAVADVNEDGRPDVLVGSEDSMLVSVLLANPDGTLSYTPGVSDFATGNRTRFVSVADFTGDGIPDLITAGYSLGAAVLPGRGDGTFAARIVTISNSFAEWAGAAGDFDRDGNADVVFASGQAEAEGVLFTLLGQGDGTFSEIKPDAAVGRLPIEIAVGDFNRDGWLDVATVNAFGDSVSVLLNDQSWSDPVASASISDATVIEGNTGTTIATFTVTLSNAVGADVTVTYNTANGSALAGSDYTAASGAVTIPAGQTTRTFTVAVLGDRLAEPIETFVVNLSAPQNTTIGDGQGVGTILDNEPRISITDVSTTEGNSKQPKSFTFKISLSNAYDQAVTVNYATANGMATAGSDYQSKAGTVTFAPGETNKTVTVAVIGDKQQEANETFFVNLSGAIGAEIADSQGLATILNDDGGRAKNGRSLFALAVDDAFEDWMSLGRKKRG